MTAAFEDDRSDGATPLPPPITAGAAAFSTTKPAAGVASSSMKTSVRLPLCRLVRLSPSARGWAAGAVFGRSRACRRRKR